MILAFQNELNFDSEYYKKVYETIMKTIKDGLVEKLKHPFKDLDKES